MNNNKLAPLVLTAVIILGLFLGSWILIEYDRNPELEVYHAKDEAIVFPSLEIYKEVIQDHPEFHRERQRTVLTELVKSGLVALLNSQNVRLLGKEGSLLKIETDDGEIWYTTQDQLDQVIDEPQ
jgi:hypothetical protein